MIHHSRHTATRYVRRRLSVVAALIFMALPSQAQVDLFVGADLAYADVNFSRLYDYMVTLTPSAKWAPATDWLLSTELWVPMISDGYASRETRIRLVNATVARQVHFQAARQHFKFTAGLFSRRRYGIDAKWMWPVNDWLLLQAQAGLTDYYWMAIDETRFSKSSWRTTAVAGCNVWLHPWQTELRLQGGRYIDDDWGMEGSVYRHFKHCSVGLYANVYDNNDNKGSKRYHSGGGFKVVMMLPPYRRSQAKVRLRPASNFRLTYSAKANSSATTLYATDIEENERQLSVDVDWGLNETLNPSRQQ